MRAGRSRYSPCYVGAIVDFYLHVSSLLELKAGEIGGIGRFDEQER